MRRPESRSDAVRGPLGRLRPFASGIALLAVALIASGSVASAPRAPQAAAAPSTQTERNALARKWFADAKLGLFVHWGVYSLLGKGEWVMDRDKLSIGEYAKLPPRFHPSRFDAEAWVKLAKGAGARYITVTSKHHDGFCLFDSKLTNYDIVDATPLHADPLRALADACRQQRIKLFFYYSLLDWHHPDYFPRGKTGGSTGREGRGDWKRYVAYYQGQVRELCTNYGEIGGIWFDGLWDRPNADWDLAGTYRMIHELQPGALVGNNHHADPIPGEDFQMFEQDMPGENAAGFNAAGVAADLPLETCLTINDSWGYNAADVHYKSGEQLIRALVGAAGRGANLLVNVGPRPDGTIGPHESQRLLELGKWLAVNGESIYGTRRGPIAPQPWGVSTAKGSKDRPTEVFLHVLKSDAGAPIILGEATASLSPYLFGKDTPLRLTQAAGGMALEVPKDAREPVDTIVVLRPQVIGRTGR
jgi:alpha-L-fucosidase